MQTNITIEKLTQEKLLESIIRNFIKFEEKEEEEKRFSASLDTNKLKITYTNLRFLKGFENMQTYGKNRREASVALKNELEKNRLFMDLVDRPQQ
ncbi:hypothetical protein K2X40_04015 [Candidatus Babeliales bacterium]|nr:hypothetical protein [Candidatus Babeliales bacterium]